MRRPMPWWVHFAGSGCLILLLTSALDLRAAPSAPASAPVQLRAVTKPVIAGFTPAGCIPRGGTLMVRGNGFGSVTGKSVALNGGGIHLDLTVLSWTTETILATVPNHPRMLAGKKYSIGIEKTGHAGWLSNTDKTVTLCSAAASDGSQKDPSGRNPTSDGRLGGSDQQDGTTSAGDTPPVTSGGPPGAVLPPPPQDLPPPSPKDTTTIEPGELIVISASMAEAQALVQPLQALGLNVKRRTALSKLGLVVSVLRVPNGSTVGDALARVREVLPKVWADANHRYELLGEEANRYGRRLIGWNGAADCGRGLRLGLLDSAVDAHHPSLRGRAIIRKSFLAAGITPAPADHGTAIAALLIANSMPSGLAGLMPSARLHAAEVLRERGKKRVDTTAEWITLALDWLADQGVDIINMSLGGPRNLLVETAVRRLQERGIAVVAAAGNGGEKSQPVYPAAQSGVVAVTAVDAAYAVYRNATRGDYIAFSAPGVDLWTAAPGRDGVYVSGTSYATPFVTAALARERQKNPKVSWQTLQQQLQKKSRDLGAPGKDPVFGWGLVQTDGCAVAKKP